MEKNWDRRSPWIATGLYAALVAVLAYHHEMWRDEVRAFSVAVRNPSWSSLFLELRHEGHPILWYAGLRIGYAFTHSTLVLPVAAAAIGVLTAWLIMKYAPFPLWLRLPAVFGTFLVYELTVVARNYGIGVLFMTCACIAFANRQKRPLVLAICLALMANTSVHAALGALILLAAWIFDLSNPDDRRELLSLQGCVSICLVVTAVIFALWTAHPTPDMAWAFSPATLDGGKIIRTIFSDPGATLRGSGGDPASVGELPWRMVSTSIDFPRLIIDAAFAWLLWKLRHDWKAFILVVMAFVSFGLLFRNVYSGGPRHEGLLLFLLFSIAWMSSLRTPSGSRAMAVGLLPFFALQSLTLPLIANRYATHRESNSKAYGAWIRSNPQYRNAILMGEPDYMMEALPYYVENRVYMPRQQEFQWRVYFDKGEKRERAMSLGVLQSIADSVSCVEKVPVLLAIGDRYFEYRTSGFDRPSYDAVFTWSTPEWLAFRKSALLVGRFPYATSDEIYRIYEVDCPTP